MRMRRGVLEGLVYRWFYGSREDPCLVHHHPQHSFSATQVHCQRLLVGRSGTCFVLRGSGGWLGRRSCWRCSGNDLGSRPLWPPE